MWILKGIISVKVLEVRADKFMCAEFSFPLRPDCIMSCKAIDIVVIAVSPVKRSQLYSQQLQYETILP